MAHVNIQRKILTVMVTVLLIQTVMVNVEVMQRVTTVVYAKEMEVAARFI